MEHELLSLPGYTACEFLLVLQPHDELWNAIRQEKDYFKEQYKCETTFGLPHITFVKFQQYEMMQPRIVQYLRAVAVELPVIKVELKNYGSFPSHTIYINITSKVPITETVKAIRSTQKLMKMDKDHKPHFIMEPHLTIARKLQPWQYEKAWLEYEHKDFHGRFMADHMLLLKRRPGEKYQKVGKFEFKNQSQKAVQKGLF